ncbi:kinesin-like protein KIN-14C isoform X2 [Mangifera indica]|uniref:kinesin-like protein KIN-14C isoform X2 n=1 Tax=Mangifera indica TaxID=29780 RepID=UPI001CFA05DA|nr:kinesin-like protein KIN-14C isoform X2 [Mangifera indica]
MSSASALSTKEDREHNGPNLAVNGEISDTIAKASPEAEANQRALLVEWLNSILPHLNLSIKASDEELKACLIDGTLPFQILKRLRLVSDNEVGDSCHSSVSSSENIRRFLETLDKLGISGFAISDLEKGYMKPVIGCLLKLRAKFSPTKDNFSVNSMTTKSENEKDVSSGGPHSSVSGEERRRVLLKSQSQGALHRSSISDHSAALLHQVGHTFHEVFQIKQGRCSELPAAKISEMMKSHTLDHLLFQNAPTQSLLCVVNGILDESVERKNGEIPYRVVCLLRKVIQEIERRISTQAEHLRKQNNVFKAREQKYQSKIQKLEALASGTGEVAELVVKQLQQLKAEKLNVEEKKKLEEENVVKLVKEKDQSRLEISVLKQELASAKKKCELRCLQVETEAESAKADLEAKLRELEGLLTASRNKVKELEEISDSKIQGWSRKENIYKSFLEFQLGALREMKCSSHSIKQEVLKTQKNFSDEFHSLGVKLKELGDAVENYHNVLAENRQLFNEVQELKGNIRVYCRARPFLLKQTGKQSCIEYIGENGEIIISNPSKPGKDGQRVFKFNKVYGPVATQVEVFSDIQPLIRSVLDGYGVCIFAYGQTGSGKTFTMSGPDGAGKEDWGVNFRALNDLFNISQNRRSSIKYEIGVQMLEIYNEQVRDLLSRDGPQKKVGIISSSPAHGIAVPDASMHPVRSTEDVMELIDIGLKSRAVSATALNERSSRSHSVVSIHVRGKDMINGSPLHGNLHLVDLAGSERVDRSEVTGDRLREAQHINKSLSALGDVIFALAQKSPHVPFRNSKLTQLLQSSLGGQAKTLMFVQLNPDVNSYSESLSTLKFAERVSGVELGTARSSKEGRDVRELMEQVASLKDTITKKDEEIERLQLLKHLKNACPIFNSEKRGVNLSRYGSLSSSKDFVNGIEIAQRNLKPPSGKGLRFIEKAALGSGSQHSDKLSEVDSSQCMDDSKCQNELLMQSNVTGGASIKNVNTDGNVRGLEDTNLDRLSDKSDSGLSLGEYDCSKEFTLPPERSKSYNNLQTVKRVSKVAQSIIKKATLSVSRDSSKDSVSGTRTAQRSLKLPSGKGLRPTEKATLDDSSQHSNKFSKVGSSQCMDDLKCQNELLVQSNVIGGALIQNVNIDGNIPRAKRVSRVARSIIKKATLSVSRDSSRVSISAKKTANGGSTFKPLKPWQ